jgi:hypothetical protein
MTRRLGGFEGSAWIVGGLVAAGGLLLLVFICGIAMPELVDGRFRTYKQFYHDIEIGMTREQVFEVMEKRYAANPARQRPKIMGDTPERLGFFMNPEKSREPNCEGIFLAIKDGKVIRKQYSMD